jgi:hypothetical protein
MVDNGPRRRHNAGMSQPYEQIKRKIEAEYRAKKEAVEAEYMAKTEALEKLRPELDSLPADVPSSNGSRPAVEVPQARRENHSAVDPVRGDFLRAVRTTIREFEKERFLRSEIEDRLRDQQGEVNHNYFKTVMKRLVDDGEIEMVVPNYGREPGVYRRRPDSA